MVMFIPIIGIPLGVATIVASMALIFNGSFGAGVALLFAGIL